MKLLIDTADTQIWTDLAPQGYWAGITTNPLLMKRVGLPCSIDVYQMLYDKATDLGFEEIHFQVFGDDWVECAEAILSIGPSARVKIPAVGAVSEWQRRLPNLTESLSPPCTRPLK